MTLAGTVAALELSESERPLRRSAPERSSVTVPVEELPPITLVGLTVTAERAAVGADGFTVIDENSNPPSICRGELHAGGEAGERRHLEAGAGRARGDEDARGHAGRVRLIAPQIDVDPDSRRGAAERHRPGRGAAADHRCPDSR